RESDRLQELLKEFDTYLNESEDEFTPLLLPATTLPETSLHATEDDQTEIAPATLLPARTLPLELLSIIEVLEPLIVSAQVIAQERDLELHTEISPDLPRVRGNAKGLREVLSNLIDNALKYTPQGGQIDIRVGILAQTSEGGTIVPSTDRNLPDTIEQATLATNAKPPYLAILISDTGPGIPPQDLEHLFQRHYRGVQASTAIPGSGLGLAIAKELIEQMQGKIEVFSPARLVWAKLYSDFAINQTQDNQTQGTTFVVWLPIE
ncbi:MAG TPA: ATP-binding protein, partial [Coleofasciculaceae cyanobacterium]